MSHPVHKVNDLKQLRQLVTQDEAGRAAYLYDKMQVGDVWWIPDSVSSFGQKEKHPWVVVVGYQPKKPPVMASPRTSQLSRQPDRLYTPAGLLPGLDKEGEIVLRFRRTFPVRQFCEFEYIGRLSDEWISKLRAGIARQAGGER